MNYSLTRAEAIKEYKKVSDAILNKRYAGIAYSTFTADVEKLVEYANKLKDYYNL